MRFALCPMRLSFAIFACPVKCEANLSGATLRENFKMYGNYRGERPANSCSKYAVLYAIYEHSVAYMISRKAAMFAKENDEKNG